MATKRKADRDDDDGGRGYDRRPQSSVTNPDAEEDLAAVATVDDDIGLLLERLHRDKLVSLVRSAAVSDSSVLAEIHRVADLDPSRRKLFVHGLDWATVPDGLRSAFSPHGEIEECRVVSDKSTGKSKGYGFVVFRSRASARAALRRPQKLIDGRMTYCQFASAGAPSTASIPQSPSHANHNPSSGSYGNLARKIYVGNVKDIDGDRLDGDRLRTFFSRFGEIEEGPLGFDLQTGRPKGFALFVYKTEEAARRALMVPNKEFEGRLLYCEKATECGKSSRGGGGYARASNSADMGFSQQAASRGQGTLAMGAGQDFPQMLQPNDDTLALLVAAEQNPAAFGFNPALLASLNPAMLASLGAGGQAFVNSSMLPPSAAPSALLGYGMEGTWYQNAPFQVPQGFEGASAPGFPAAQQASGGGASGNIGGQG